MAGDIKVRERVIILPPDGSLASAEGVVRQIEGRVLHCYGPRVLVAALPPGGESAVKAGVRNAAVEREPAAFAAGIRAELDPVEKLGLEALELRQSASYAKAKAKRPHEGADWDSGAADAPICHDIGASEAEARELLAQAPTSTRLTGSVAVGIVIVEGPNASLKFSAAERTKVVAEVQNGLGWLASQSPSGVTWNYDVHIVTLSVKPGPASLTSSQKEELWRDPAMKQLGYGPGINGVRDYVEDLRTAKKTKWAYCGFFTKYPLGHFAYASIGGPRLVMAYANDGWGPDNIDRVFAHETGHIFGAPDEYSASGCNCGGSWGFYGKPNGNCANCAPGGGVACIMKSNSWEMCTYTPYHLGFPLVEQRYSGIWRQGGGGYYLWVNANWTSFRKKWQELGKKKLRLVDLEISGSGSKLRYNGVWRQGTGAYYLWVNASWTSFRKKWKELSKKKLRLVDIEVRVINGKRRYSGVWLPGNDAHYLWVNASWTSFVKKWKELAKKKLRLVDIKIVRHQGKTQYNGVWRQGTGGYYLWVNASWTSFVKKWKDLGKKNLRLVDLEVTNFGGQRRYSGVWLPGSDGYYLWANANWQSFRDKWEELAAQNLRLIDLEVTAPGDPSGSPTPESPSREEAEALFSQFGGISPVDAGDPSVLPAEGDGGGMDEVLAAEDEEEGLGGGEVDVTFASAGIDDDVDGLGGGDLVDGSEAQAAQDDGQEDGLGGGDFAGEAGAELAEEEDGYGGGSPDAA